MYRFYRVCFSQLISYSRGRTLYISAFPRATNSVNNNIDTIRPRRAILYVPGHDRRKIDKLSNLNVDCAVLDCEDGVAANKKVDARNVIQEIAGSFDFKKIEFAVRINSIDSGLAEEDLMSVLSGKRYPDTLMVPKLENSDQIIWINEKLKLHSKQITAKKLNLVLFIESAKSLLDLRQICEKAVDISKDGLFRFEGLVFGSDDFCADIGATRTEEATELLTARQLFILVAKSFRVQAIDMVHINYKDVSGLIKSCEEGARMGFTGKQVIHPNQVPIVQKTFSPSPEKVEWAKELIQLFKEHQKQGKGAFTFRGAMIDKPLLLQAEYIVKMSEQLND
ncbi:citramalyl-CoA lyase, mitochondrial-like [Argiope bruennichi]|uniref:Citramalyl-CoA lyase, mitochondrial n=1 Tax=Argiope bruennichi TaxID=94029 RepID=A0A8T0E840_ARGBR|nr:citramalyl-CoA lyase, mitochondrial-like [Argiope bruennichi]KAF8767486.1 Citramalyl-CoA lyase like protein [Argiope bruennichi]